MSTETTPALRRAAEQNYMTRVGSLRGVPDETARQVYREATNVHHSWAEATRPVLTAALDRQEIARSLYEHHVAEVEWRDGVKLSGWADVQQSTGEWYLEQADGVIATVLGTDQ